MGQYNIEITHDATDDLYEIYRYIKKHDSSDAAKYVFEQIKKAIGTLADQPSRGSYPNELITAGVKDYREIYFKPYRIVYIVTGNVVSVVLIADGRRELKQILELRVLK